MDVPPSRLAYFFARLFVRYFTPRHGGSMQSYLVIGGNHDGLYRMDKMKRKIALLFAALLLWTAMMSVARVVFDQELDATNLGVIISVGAIVLSLTALAGYVFEITQSKIA